MPAKVKPLHDRISHSIVVVTPETAARWLELNTDNRDLKQWRVDQYAADMIADRWTFNGEPIQFDHSGVLRNGQHRLWAVVESGVTQQFLVVRGLPPAAQLTMDQGQKRTPAEQLTLSGVAADNTMASAIRVYIQWGSGRFFGDQAAKRAKITTSEVVQWAADNPDLVEHLRDLSTAGLRRLPARPAVGLAIALRLYLIDPDDAQAFFGSLISGANMTPNSPRLALLNRLRRLKESSVATPDRDVVAYFVMAWNAERAGRSMSKLQRPSGAAWTVSNFPVPK